MKLLAGIVRELAGMFVDDGMLALAIIATIGVAALVADEIPGTTAGVVLLAGLLFALFANVMSVER